TPLIQRKFHRRERSRSRAIAHSHASLRQAVKRMPSEMLGHEARIVSDQATPLMGKQHFGELLAASLKTIQRKLCAEHACPVKTIDTWVQRHTRSVAISRVATG